MGEQRLLVLSDIHNEEENLEMVFNWGKERSPGGEIGLSVSLGDGVADIKRSASLAGFSSEWIEIKGNNDFDVSLPETCVFDLCGHRFFVCHGHKHSIYSSYDALIAAALREGANAALFGHTHAPVFYDAQGLLLINPGSVGRPRSAAGATFAVLECAHGRPLEAEFWAIKRGKIVLLERCIAAEPVKICP